MSWPRRHPAPAGLRELLRQRPGERALAWTEAEQGTWLIAGRLALWQWSHGDDARPDGAREHRADGDGTETWDWADVARAALDPASAELTVVLATPGGPALRWRLMDRGAPRFARVVRERVQASIVLAETVTLSAGLQATVALRRAEDRQAFLQVFSDGETAALSPEDAVLLETVARRVRAASGSPA